MKNRNLDTGKIDEYNLILHINKTDTIEIFVKFIQIPDLMIV